MLTHDQQRLIHAAAYSAVSVAMALTPLQAAVAAPDREAITDALAALDVAYARLMTAGTAHASPRCDCCSCAEAFNPYIRTELQRVFNESATDDGCELYEVDTHSFIK